MKNFVSLLILMYVFMLPNDLQAQFRGWDVYNTENSDLPSNNISSLALDSKGNVWIGTSENGLAKFDGKDIIVYDSLNSELPVNRIRSLTVDQNDNLWIATTKGGLVRLEGETWTIYNKNNSSIPHNVVSDVTIDNYDNIWLTTQAGIAKFDREYWEVYNTSNGLPGLNVTSIAFDILDNIWMGIPEIGVVKFDLDTSTIYLSTQYSNISFKNISCIAIDRNDVKWFGTFTDGLFIFDSLGIWRYEMFHSLPFRNISSVALDSSNSLWVGTGDGLVYFDGTDWIVYNSSISGLPSDSVSAIAIGKKDDRWIGTNKGLAHFYDDETGINNQKVNQNSQLAYPNPFTDITTIQFSLNEPSFVIIDIYNSIGEKVDNLVSNFLDAGEHTKRLNAEQLPNGIYFCTIQIGNNFRNEKLILIR